MCGLPPPQESPHDPDVHRTRHRCRRPRRPRHLGLRLVARTRGIAISSAKIEAEVDIGKDETSFGLAVRLHAHVGGVDAATAQALADGAHEVCPYSKATRGNIPVTVRGSAA